MKSQTSKELLFGGLMGLSGFVAPGSLLCMVYYFTGITTTALFPVKYLLLAFIMSLTLWLYCFYAIRSLKKTHGTK